MSWNPFTIRGTRVWIRSFSYGASITEADLVMGVGIRYFPEPRSLGDSIFSPVASGKLFPVEWKKD